MAEIRTIFAASLSARLDRSADDIREEGLNAGDFKTNERVELTLPDGSTMSLQYAFVVSDAEQGIVGVFSEHCGYYCFGMVDLHVTEFRDDEITSHA